ncbi:act minimal PKS acyl carrier protein [Nonomuraea fuscirosea]|uniref:Act minimal PKS acyl carrier protein n=1 Tax=Nonomuraea fuscirosea TaxID=1291556 RepID=A0A2T0MXF2_9ACTN|nr:acyl carrier protein [Nonomuraea fuscirosea]PRX63772.1 act minimal PKS acyl carrier protein [Nonomuraea fuscirosea]
MREFTLDDLKRILRASGGESDVTSLEGDIADIAFGDLGYDSLAVLELAGRVEDEYAVVVPDAAVQELPTPAAVVDFVNARLREAVSR